MTEVLNTGGALAYAIIGLAGFGLLVALGLGAVSFMKRRVPLTAFALIPVLVLALGGIGSWLNAGDVFGALDAADSAAIPAMATDGYYQALGIDWFARWIAALLFALSAGCASLGALSAGDDTRMTPIAGAMTGISTVLGMICVGAYATSEGIGSQAWMLVGILAVGGFGVTLGAFRRALDEQAPRVAGMRFTGVACMFLAVVFASGAVVMGTDVEVFGPGGLAAQADDLISAITVYTDLAVPAFNLSLLAIAFAVVIAYFGVFYELGEVVQRYTLVDVWGVLALILVLGGVRVVEGTRTDALHDVATNAPAKDMFAALGADLMPALLSIEKNVKEVHPSDGGFGDVLYLQKNEDNSYTWVRRYAWNGSSWDEDAEGTPLENVALHPRRPLLAVSNGGSAQAILDALDQSRDGKALLLMRASEVKGDVLVPPELAHVQVTFLELTKGSERDLEKELWSAAGARNYNWGPTSWYGEAEGEEPLIYADAVAEATGATGLHVLVPDDRAMVKDIVNSCLPWVMSRKDDGAELSDRWCHLSRDPVEEVRTAASEIWPLPEPENTRMTVRHLEGDQLPEDLVRDRFLRELGAIDYCIGVLKDEGEEAQGQLRLEVNINRRGRMGDMIIHERSRVQSQAVARCVAKRFNELQFEMPEVEKPEEPADGDKKAEPPPLPKYEVLVDLR